MGSLRVENGQSSGQAQGPLWCCSLVAESGTAAPSWRWSRCWSPGQEGGDGGVPAHLAEILRVVLGGHKHDRLVLGPHHVAQQVEQHSGLGILPHQEEGGLWREVTRVGSRGRGGAGGGGGFLTPRAGGGARAEPHLELLVEFRVHI